MTDQRFCLENECLTWELDCADGVPRSVGFLNRCSGRYHRCTAGQELALVFSASSTGLVEPTVRVVDLRVVRVECPSPGHAVVELASETARLAVRLHYKLDGPTRRKWAEAENQGPATRLLLDWELDDLCLEGLEHDCDGGGQGQPVWIGDEAFAAIEHPSGLNQAEGRRVRLGHCPGLVLAPGGRCQSQVALVSVSPAGRVRDHFLDYIQERSRRPKRFLSVYTPFGINNQWGACPTLDDEQTLEVLDLLERWQHRGLRFDYFTLDTGWVHPGSDLTRFKPNCYPDGPRRVIERVQGLGMRFGLWFATSWGTQSCWDYPPAYPDQRPPGLPYREGYPETLGGITFCLGWEPYYQLLERAVLHHVTENGVRFVKFDGGSYYCDDPTHGHLPGRYSVEAMHERLIRLAARLREAAPDLFVMWYWGLRSPFWALHGDSIFESGLHMEGSGTSAVPALHYRDSVNLAQDQNAQYARTIPPLVKDSLGVWLSDTRWGNFMGKERWKEALVMDLGRGNLLFPNLWGNLYHLSDADVDWLARLQQLARRHESLFLHRRTLAGDPWQSEPYGYAYGRGSRALVFLNNPHFASRRIELRLDGSLGLAARAGARFHLLSHFPTRERLQTPGDQGHAWGEVVEVWLRPFEVLLLEVSGSSRSGTRLPERSIDSKQAESLGRELVLRPAECRVREIRCVTERGEAPGQLGARTPCIEGKIQEASTTTLAGMDRPANAKEFLGRDTEVSPRLEVRFAEAERFAARGDVCKTLGLEGHLPEPLPARPILAVVVRLRQDDAEWRYSPTVVEIVQVVARVGDQGVQLVPVPDGRQYGNTQKAGCSWVVYKARLGQDQSGAPLSLAVHAWLPAAVEIRLETWVVDRWWEEDARPMPDGYYTYAPS
ncbi:MAG: hypothetical protein WDA75_20050 [Candidatus Latescibacterota bacterium]